MFQNAFAVTQIFFETKDVCYIFWSLDQKSPKLILSLNFFVLFSLWFCVFQIKRISFTLVLKAQKLSFAFGGEASQFYKGSFLNGWSNNFANLPFGWKAQKKES